tara:strand:- start:3375 stop:4100 length:726 start_codon:yes stop_codon:yes gene_type:complete
MKKKTLLNYLEFKALLSEAKRTSDPIWCKFIYRPLSFPAGWLFYKIGMKANSVSLLSIALALISFIIIISGTNDDVVLASFLMLSIALLDCIDGNIARARGEAGPGGEWMDALSGYTVYALLPLALGLHLNLHSPYAPLPGLWILVGAITSIANLFLRLLYQKFVNSISKKSTQTGLKEKNFLFSKFSSEMGLVGWMMPALLVASLTEMLEVYLVVYCFFYMTSAALVTFVLFKKITSHFG